MNKGRKISGGKYHANRKKKSYEKTNQERFVILGETKRKSIRGMGGQRKTVLLSTNIVNISDGKKIKKVEITNVLETPQNLFLARQNRLSKGVVIETTAGKARITNRPSREGSVNAILLKK